MALSGLYSLINPMALSGLYPLINPMISRYDNVKSHLKIFCHNLLPLCRITRQEYNGTQIVRFIKAILLVCQYLFGKKSVLDRKMFE